MDTFSQELASFQYRVYDLKLFNDTVQNYISKLESMGNHIYIVDMSCFNTPTIMTVVYNDFNYNFSYKFGTHVDINKAVMESLLALYDDTSSLNNNFYYMVPFKHDEEDSIIDEIGLMNAQVLDSINETIFNMSFYNGIKTDFFFNTQCSAIPVTTVWVIDTVGISANMAQANQFASLSKLTRRNIITHLMRMQKQANEWYRSQVGSNEIVQRMYTLLDELNAFWMNFDFLDVLRYQDWLNLFPINGNHFIYGLQELENNNIEFELNHICNSTAFLKYPNLRLNTARIGSAFLGMTGNSNDKFKTVSKLKTKVIDNKDKALMNALMKWREEKSMELEKPENQILPKTVMTRIVEKKPVSIRELKEISKLGTTRIKSFGADIINMVLDFQGFKKQEFDDESSKKEMNLSSSALKTLELLDEDYSVTDVAKERGLSRVTIEGHIVEIVKNGFYNVEDFVSDAHREIITEYFEETRDPSLTVARDVLGDEFTYFELKLVLATLEF
jgi:hypothetical protein